ncbi:class I SAM-dependent methyltransferase [Candidatus Margulisiibacteriota bacterium]
MQENLKMLLSIHKNLPQEGPGSKKSTLKALSLIPEIPEKLSILDIGCGPGRQTLDLATHTNGQIIALDLFEQYLNQLRSKINELKLSNKIKLEKGSMDNLPFPKNSFDLIWSEGAAYLMGFANALKYWRDFLKPSGYLAVTEIVWITDNIPKELKAFWLENYPGIKSFKENIPIITKLGYKLMGHFTLPESDWHQYYTPLQKRIDILKKDCSPELLEYIKSEQTEIELYQKYSKYYSYEFYVMKVDS